MALPSLFVGLLVLAGGLWQQAQPAVAPIPGNLRWVRGIVTAVSPDSLTLKLRENTLTLTIDPTTEVIRASPADRATRAPVDPLTVGSLIEAHYTDLKAIRRAVLIVGGVPGGSAASSKRPGRSYRGLVKETKRGTLSMRVETRTRSVKLDSRTKLTDTDGRPLAIGWKAIASQLWTGEEVLVTYDEQSDDMQVNDMTIFSSSQRALEIRKLRHVTPVSGPPAAGFAGSLR
jgi:hypothetical protein